MAAVAFFLVYLIIEEPFADTRGAFLIVYVGFVLVSKIPQSAQNRVGRSAAECAKREIIHSIRDPFKSFYIAVFTLTATNCLQYTEKMFYPFPARYALAAGLLLKKFKKIPGDVHHTCILIHYDHAAGAHHGTGFREVFEIHGKVQKRFRDTTTGRSSGLYRLEFFLLKYSAADIENNLP